MAVGRVVVVLFAAVGVVSVAVAAVVVWAFGKTFE